MHQMDSNETHGEKARLKLRKNITRWYEQILEEAPHKTVVVWPLTSHLTNHHSKTNKTWWVQLEKYGQMQKRGSFMNSYRWIHQRRPTRSGDKASSINLRLALPHLHLFSQAVWHSCRTGNCPSKADSWPEGLPLRLSHLRVGELHCWHSTGPRGPV